MTGVYQPDRGDFVWVDFTPNAGTEQGGRRPALVLSPQKYNIATGLMIAVPITNQVKGSPWEVPLPRGAGVTGAVLANQVKSLDWIARRAEFQSKSNDDIMCEVLGRIEAILALDCS